MFISLPDMHSIRLMVGVAWLLCAAALASAATISARTYECDDLEARLDSLESATAALLHEIEIRRCSPSAPSPLLCLCLAGEASSSFLSGLASRELLQAGKQPLTADKPIATPYGISRAVSSH
jgi:hypothetical protein